jgi:hypothetical protein
MPVWLAALLLAAGTAGSMYTQRRTAEAQDAQLRAGERQSKPLRERAFAEILKSGEQYAPKQRAKRLDETQAKSEANLVGALEQAANERADANAVAAPGGVQSRQYLAAKAKGEAQTTREGVQLARLLSKFGSHGKLRADENLSRADSSSRAGVDMASARHFLDAARLAAGRISPNPWLSLLFGTMQGVGAGGIAGGGGGAKAAPAAQGSTIGGGSSSASALFNRVGGPIY